MMSERIIAAPMLASAFALWGFGAALGQARPQAPAAPPSQVIENVRWVATPSSRDMAAAYPPEAAHKRLNGSADIQCAIAAGGALTSCTVLSETPAGQGFGAASLAVARFYRGAGLPAGQTVTIPVSWRLPR